MLEFRNIELQDREWINEILATSNFRGSEYSFGNNFTWRGIFKITICQYKGFYIAKLGTGKETKFIFPAGTGDRKEVVQLLKQYSANQGTNLIFASMTKESRDFLEENYGDQVVITPIRDSFDYVYKTDDLVNLSGKKYHSKRNHINRFLDNNWTYEPITQENIAECLEMNELWCKENNCKDEYLENGEKDEDYQSKLDEFCVVKCSFKYFSQLEYIGGLLRVDGKPQAFTFGEQLNSDTFIVHVEKALRRYQGAYPMINRSFAEVIDKMGKYEYINREEDTGAENLRKAKLSYKPVFLEEKFKVEFKD